MKFVVLVGQPRNGIGSEYNDAPLDMYSGYALRAACGIKSDGDSVIAVSMGQSDDVLRFCLTHGADEAFLLSDQAFLPADTIATSKTLSAFIRRFASDFDLIICGRGSCTGQVPAEIAGILNIQQFCYVTGIRIRSGFEVFQDYGDESRCCRVPRGSLLSVSYSDPPETVRSSDSSITVLDRMALGLGMYSVGSRGSKIRIVVPDSSGRGDRSE